VAKAFFTDRGLYEMSDAKTRDCRARVAGLEQAVEWFWRVRSEGVR